MIDWYKKVVFENYANFNGRARRSEYWYFTLANIILSIITMLIDKMLNLKFGINSLYGLAVFIPGIAVATRRLHDIGKSGWILLITYAVMIVAAAVLAINVFSSIAGGTSPSFGIMMIVPCVVVFAVAIWMIVLFCTEGDEGTNKYGEDPKGEAGEEINEIGLE